MSKAVGNIPNAAGATGVGELTGDVPCLSCGYNLRSLSVRDGCPECGLRVRATLLSIVDPYARELVPLTRPRITSALLLFWGMGLSIAYFADVLSALAPMFGLPLAFTAPIRSGLVFGGVLAVVGGTGFLRPHRELGWMRAASVLAGLLLAAGAVGAAWVLRARLDPLLGVQSFGSVPVTIDRPLANGALGLFLAGSLAFLRPAARELAARSVLVRTGRVDRQTMLAAIAALLVGVAGAGVQAFASGADEHIGEVAGLLGGALVLLSRILVGLAVVGILIDTVRLARVLARPVVSYEDLVAVRAGGRDA